MVKNILQTNSGHTDYVAFEKPWLNLNIFQENGSWQEPALFSVKTLIIVALLTKQPCHTATQTPGYASVPALWC